MTTLCQFTHPTLCQREATHRVVTRCDQGITVEDRTICPAHLDTSTYVPVGYTVTVTPLQSQED